MLPKTLNNGYQVAAPLSLIVIIFRPEALRPTLSNGLPKYELSDLECNAEVSITTTNLTELWN